MPRKKYKKSKYKKRNLSSNLRQIQNRKVKSKKNPDLSSALKQIENKNKLQKKYYYPENDEIR